MRLPVLVLRHCCQANYDRIWRERTEKASLKHEWHAIWIESHIVERVVLAAQGLVRLLRKIVDARMHFIRQLCWTLSFTLLFAFLDSLS